ncbi:MAG: endo-1,4-beta-xylanase [Verrucomicrobia bacterium]|nr:endo-1,4-beta-xylanase [Verrucomicrobiota bacterium]
MNHPLNRRVFLKTTAAGAVLLGAAPARTADRRPDGPGAGDDEILARCKDRIEKHRKGEGVIAVRGADGKPVPGAAVRLEQTRHDFLFGCNFFRFGRLPDPALEAEYRRRFAALMNFATLGFYWPSYEPTRGRPNYDYTDQALDWTRDHGIVCKGHPLVWDFADPRWLPREFAEIRTLSNARVRDCVRRFRGRLDVWDVVNEPTHLGRFKTRMGEWAMDMGAVPYVREHLLIARDANPAATLLVNDYRTGPAFYRILDALREDGKLLFDAVGIQSHMHGGAWPLRNVWDICDRYGRLGLPIHFTETTLVSGPRTGPGERWGPSTPELEAHQAEAVARFYTALFAHPAAHALTWWDFSDHGAWQGAAAGLVRRDMSPKPAYDRLMALVKEQWWSRLDGRTDTRGECALRVFHGTHRVTASLPDGRSAAKTIHVRRGQPNRFDLTLA